MRVAVSGAAGRMGRLVARAVAEANDLELVGLYDPSASEKIGGVTVSGDPQTLSEADVIVEFTHPGVVMENLERWRGLGIHAVVGTSGFDSDRLGQVAECWGSGPPNVLVVPNFSLGAVLMMRMAEQLAPYFSGAEIIELHHDGKLDAPSGTALSTAERMAAATAAPSAQGGALSPARGADVSGIRVHSVRLPGLLAHQEVILGNPGEILTVRHDSTDRSSFMPGVLLAIRNVARLDGFSVGLEQLVT